MISRALKPTHKNFQIDRTSTSGSRKFDFCFLHHQFGALPVVITRKFWHERVQNEKLYKLTNFEHAGPLGKFSEILTHYDS